MVVINTLIIKINKEAGVDHIRVEHEIQEDNNNGTPISIPKNNVTNVEINTVKITYNSAQQRIKFARNVPSEVILQKFVAPLMLTAWEIIRMNNKKN